MNRMKLRPANTTRFSGFSRWLLFIMHRLFESEDTDSVARLLEERVKNLYEAQLRSHYTGLLFGKYDLLLECDFAPEISSYAFTRDFRNWIWHLQSDKREVRGCVSSLLCYGFAGFRRIVKPSFKIRTYSFFRLDRCSAEQLLYSVQKINVRHKDVKLIPMWNPSAMSYVLETGSDDFLKTLQVLRKLRIETLMRDFCTFVTLRWNADDAKKHYEGLGAMINVKLPGQYQIDNFVRRFPDSRVRLGYFDAVRTVTCTNLADAFRLIKETRQFLLDQTPDIVESRTATILTFNSKALGGELIP